MSGGQEKNFSTLGPKLRGNKAQQDNGDKQRQIRIEVIDYNMSRKHGLISGILSLAAKQKASPICYRDIPHYPFYHIDGHEGKLYFGRQGNTDVMVFSGRTHAYQGYSLAEVFIFVV